MVRTSRRQFIRDLGIGSATVPFLLNLPSLGFANQAVRKQRLVVLFSPNGVVPTTFWPDIPTDAAEFVLKESLQPLEPFRDRLLTLRGVCDKVRGDGDSHMRGIGCLLTGSELYPGNIQGGSHTPAGWSSGISLDQELKNVLQAKPSTQTRFGSLEFGVMVPERADTWTRMVYAGPNKPLAPIDDPYQMFAKLYGRTQDREHLKSVLDPLYADLQIVSQQLSTEDRRLLEDHASFVREENDNMPKISRMQIDLMVNSFSADFARIATLQYTNSVGQAKMRWLGIDEGHHELSHSEDSDAASQDKLTRINRWFCEQVAYLTRRLAETPEPGGPGSLLDNTLIVWTNELGKGNSHTLDNIPFVLVGNGLDFRMGRALEYPKVPHHRLLLALAQAMGHEMKTFGNPNYCTDGPLTGLV
jgi:hypothetical protein